MSTLKFTAPVGSWLKVSDDLENVLISHQSVYPVAVYVAAAAPDMDSAYHLCTAVTPFALGGVSGVDVYVRGLTKAVDVTVTKV